MRAAILTAEHHLEMRNVDKPVIQAPDQVLIQVKTVGVCGSEVHAFEGTHPYRKAPVILGHEMAGDVVAVGEAVTDFQAGDRVIVDPQWTCGTCAYCRARMPNLCPSKKVLGTDVWPGAFGEFIISPQEAVFHLPDTLSYAQGSLIEPLTVAVHVARQAGMRDAGSKAQEARRKRQGARDSVAILGTGSIGGLVSGVCHAWGAGPIIAADIRQHCLDAARERLGATHDFLLPDANFADNVRSLTSGEGVDVVFLTADDVELVNLAFDIVKRRGRIVFVALMTDAPLNFSAFNIISKELTLAGSLMANHDDVRTALDLAASRRVDVEGILTHHLPIEDAQRGMELAHSKEEGAIKVVLEF